MLTHLILPLWCEKRGVDGGTSNIIKVHNLILPIILITSETLIFVALVFRCFANDQNLQRTDG